MKKRHNFPIFCMTFHKSALKFVIASSGNFSLHSTVAQCAVQDKAQNPFEPPGNVMKTPQKSSWRDLGVKWVLMRNHAHSKGLKAPAKNFSYSTEREHIFTRFRLSSLPSVDVVVVVRGQFTFMTSTTSGGLCWKQNEWYECGVMQVKCLDERAMEDGR